MVHSEIRPYENLKNSLTYGPKQFRIWTVERWTISDFVPLKPETKSESFEFTETNTHWSGSMKHVKTLYE